MYNRQNDLIEKFIQERYAEAHEAFLLTPEFELYKKKDKAESYIMELANPAHTDLLEGYFSSLDTLNSLYEFFLYKRGFSDCLNYLKLIGSIS